MKLVVIEGIGKKETIEKYLGAGYKVFATKGHVRDLPPKSLSVNVKKDFEPKYAIMEDKKDIVSSLEKIVKNVDEVLLATDPDREGEAISWHLEQILGIESDKPCRIEFNEISKKAVQNALKHPRAINMNLVDAQQARRVLDRLVGYKLSPVLCKKIQNKLSAGRVQSVTLRLVVEREEEIEKFVPEEYWPFASILDGEEHSKIRAVLSSKNNQKFKIENKETLDIVLKGLDNKEYIVKNIKKSVTKSKPPAPFITSSMQQDALNKLGMSLKQTTATAQTLYEGVDIPSEGKIALVTYIRTDSTRVSSDAQNEARSFIADKFGSEFVPAKPNYYASKKGAQDAHEAIRPISIERTPDSLKNVLKKEVYRLYKLIYERFLASQMAEATYNSLTIDISAGDYGFKVNGKTPLFAGYTKIYSNYQEEKEDDDETSQKLPELSVGQIMKFIEYKYEQKFTKPPARYTEASLVKMMEEKGIGRPATYTPTITLLANREYTQKEGKYLQPTLLGRNVVHTLIKFFPEIMNIQFTAQMETKLDEIEDGGKIWQKVIGEFYDGFEEKIAIALGDSFSLKAPDEKTEIVCEKCGALMVIKNGRFGKFLACPNYPKCKNSKPLDENGNVVTLAVSKSGADDGSMYFTSVGSSEVAASTEKCSKCGSDMVVKQGRYGAFLACSAYPKCKNIVSIKSKNDEVLPVCPECGKSMKKITTKKGVFYGCSGYPDCKFAVNDKPTDEKCPECGSMITVKETVSGKLYKCANKNCSYSKKVENEK